MSRIQLALNVEDLDAAIDYYRTLLGVEPHKRRSGYANFAVADPALKLVLIEGEGTGGTLNHLGVEVSSSAEVQDATVRLSDAGLDVDVRQGEVCCHAEQNKVWTADPDGARWEVYTITADDPEVATAVACC